MNIFFVSSYCSESVFSKLFNSAIVKPQISIQKFFHLLVKGLIYNGCKIQTLSGLPITSSSHKKLFWKYKSEYVDRIFYYYIPVINIKFLRHLFLWLSSAYRTFRWCVKHDKKESVIVCDLMFLWVTMPAFIIGHLWGFKVCAIVADLPVMRNTHTTRGKNSFFQSLSNKMNTWYAMNFDCFLFFAENMNCKLNRKNKPYIVIEGLVDSNFQQNSNMINSTKSIMYSGGLYEKYGIRKLLNAFLKLEDDDCELWLYGAGEMEEDIKQIAKTNPKIKYFGVVPNNEVVKAQMQAMLLINPRPSEEEYTKYSFPSKNMEYMVSGRPTLTTYLQGMPKEYLNYVYVIENETEIGIADMITKIVNKSKLELSRKGREAQQFVLVHKNNISQAKKLESFLDSVLNS